MNEQQTAVLPMDGQCHLLCHPPVAHRRKVCKAWPSFAARRSILPVRQVGAGPPRGVARARACAGGVVTDDGAMMARPVFALTTNPPLPTPSTVDDVGRSVGRLADHRLAGCSRVDTTTISTNHTFLLQQLAWEESDPTPYRSILFQPPNWMDSDGTDSFPPLPIDGGGGGGGGGVQQGDEDDDDDDLSSIPSNASSNIVSRPPGGGGGGCSGLSVCR
uniref:Uncharacterized protein n=1 Tax=Globodera rostochiensis TaxID=31243 RepID=A0A914GXY1_GLORO